MHEELSAIEERLSGNTAKALAHAVSQAVSDGALTPGRALPPIRRVAHELALSPTTVSAAWRILASAGLIHSDGRRGTRVAAPTRPRGDRYGQVTSDNPTALLDLSTGVPDVRLMPDLGASLARVSSVGVPRSYLDDPVLPELADVLRERWPYPTDRLMVVDGAMDGVDLILRCVVRFGDRVAVEHPCFPPIVDLLESIGAVAVGVPVDDEGMTLDGLTSAVAQGCSLVILQPRAHNPTGVCLTTKRARCIATLAREEGLLVVEDDSMGEVSSVDPVSVGRWAPDQVARVHSFSKSHGPDLRIAAVSAPADLIGTMQGRRALGQGWTSRLLQRVLLDLLTDASSQERVRAARDTYAKRRAALVDLLRERGVEVGGRDGINLWVPVLDETAALVHLGAAGIAAAPGRPFAVLPEDSPHLRVTIGAVEVAEAAGVADALAAAAQVTGWSARHR